MADLVTTLRSGSVLLMDGAMGTELQRRTHSLTMPSADSGLVQAIHRSYLDAGADVLLTHTFQADPIDDATWQTALRLARDLKPRFVLADVGPMQRLTRNIAAALAHRCRDADGMLLETWTSLADLALFDMMDRPPLLVSFTYLRIDGKLQTFDGATPEQCAHAASAVDAVAVGANCGKDIDLADMVELASRYRASCALPIFMRPNAGTPTRSGVTWNYPLSPATMAAALPGLLDAGVTMIGGCCGTTPAHIRALREVVASKDANRPVQHSPD